MSKYSIRPATTALLAVTTQPRLLSRLALMPLMLATAALIFSVLSLSEGQAAEPKAAPAFAAVIQSQLRLPVTDDKAILQAWYGARNFAPLWVTRTGLTPAGKAAMRTLAQVGNEGLPPARYDLSALTSATAQRDAASQAELEVALSLAVQTYLHDLRYGAANPHAPAFGVEGLAAVEKSGFAQAVADARPSNPRYGQLSQKLKVARAGRSGNQTARAQARETILALEKLRWEQNVGTPNARFAQLTTESLR